MGVLGLAASILLAFLVVPAAAQFPIRQVPQNRGPHPPVFGGLGGSGGSAPSGKTVSQPSSGPVTTPHPAVARIIVPEKDGISYGSGTLIDARGQFGLVVTNWHVVRDASGQITVQFADGFQATAQVVRTDKDWDLAALSIRRPSVQPLPISARAPQPGETLTIAGYGAGDYRVATGRCTQYLAPGEQFPYELVELAAEARQGDSGGPILNDQGEICGVLFGSGPGYTSGSYGGRVRQFLATVVPGGEPGSDNAPPTANIAATTPPPVPAWNARPEAAQPSPSSTALHQPQPVAPYAPPSLARASEEDGSSLTPALKPIDDGLLSPPPRDEFASRFDGSADEVDPRAAVENRVAASLSGHETPPASFGAAYTPLPPKAGSIPAAGVDLNAAPPDQLLAAAWKKIGGHTLIDQGKTVLALVGILSLLLAFWRLSSRREPEVQEE